MITLDDMMSIGRIGKPHGTRGEMTFFFTDDIFDRADADCLFLVVDGLPVPFFITEYRIRSGETALLTLDGVDTLDKARALTGCEVYVPKSLDDGSGSPADGDIPYKNYTVVSAADGIAIGTIEAIDDTTANTLFEIALPDGRRKLIPAAAELIKDIDDSRKRIVITIADGVLDI